MSSLSYLHYFVTLGTILATITLVISGVARALKKEFDIFGAIVLGFVCAVGGGTLRDLLIGATPVFWATDLIFIFTIIPTALMSYFYISKLPRGKGWVSLTLDLADALGLALFTIIGTEKALSTGLIEVTAIIMGVITGIFGGILRDLLSQERPMVFLGEIYALAALLGAISYVVSRNYLTEVLAMLVGMIVIFALRLTAKYANWRIPIIKDNEDNKL